MAFLRQQGPPAIVQRQYQIFDYLKAGSNSDFKQISGETLKNDLVSVNFMTVQNEKVTEYNCLRCGHTFAIPLIAPMYNTIINNPTICTRTHTYKLFFRK